MAHWPCYFFLFIFIFIFPLPLLLVMWAKWKIFVWYGMKVSSLVWIFFFFFLSFLKTCGYRNSSIDRICMDRSDHSSPWIWPLQALTVPWNAYCVCVQTCTCPNEESKEKNGKSVSHLIDWLFPWKTSRGHSDWIRSKHFKSFEYQMCTDSVPLKIEDWV